MARIRVLCVDDHQLVLEGVALIIGAHPDLEVVGCAPTGEEALRLFRALRPDVTLMDLQLPGMSGIDAIREIHAVNPAARVIVLTMYHGDEDIYRALRAGASAYLLKDTLSDELVRVVREVHTGGRPMRSDVRAQLDARAERPPLTPRETEVIELIAQGLRNKEIAGLLGISDETVQVHVKNILGKLQVSDRIAAVNVALRRGIVHIS